MVDKKIGDTSSKTRCPSQVVLKGRTVEMKMPQERPSAGLTTKAPSKEKLWKAVKAETGMHIPTKYAWFLTCKLCLLICYN